MKKVVRIMLFAVAALAVLPGLRSAQEPESRMFVIVDCTVKPSMETAFWKTAKEEVAYHAKNGFSHAWKAYAGEDGHYYFVYPIKGFAGIEELMKASKELRSKDAAGYQALSEKYAGTYESSKAMVFTFRPELSFLSENPYYPPEKMNYMSLDIWFIQPEKEGEAEGYLKDLVALNKKKGIRDIWYSLVGGLGTNQPVYVYAGPDKDQLEFIKHNPEMWKMLGDEADVVFNKLLSLCRKRESRNLWYQAELSYSPIKK